MGFASWEADEFRRMARTANDRCIALRGEVGGTCRCSIYDRRPGNCRDFLPGSPECQASRSAALLPPLDRTTDVPADVG
jgi:Fe-S-cluster containining protein